MALDRLIQGGRLLSEQDTQRNNPYEYQTELKQFAICNHRHHLPSRESDQPPSGNSAFYISTSPILAIPPNG